jgi:hypothetical protein
VTYASFSEDWVMYRPGNSRHCSLSFDTDIQKWYGWVVVFRRVRKISKSSYSCSRLHARPPVRPRARNSSSSTGPISWNLVVSIFLKSVEKIQVSFKSDNNNECFTWLPLHIFDLISLLVLRMRMFQTKVVEKIETTLDIQQRAVFRKSFRLWDIVEDW